MNFLADIIIEKQARVARATESCPLPELRAKAEQWRREAKPHALRDAINRHGQMNIIAEFKRASPSKGVIRVGAEAAQIARDYEANGAVAISVLTEESRFQGSLDDLRNVRAAVHVPVLRKDFIVDEYQIYESAAAGADAILLIVAALNDEVLPRLREIAEDELGLDALVEVHDKEELSRALASGASLIGVNNRNLRTFEVSLETSVQLATDLPPDVIAISESGLRNRAELAKLEALGYKGFLIGESLMREESPGNALNRLITGTENTENCGSNG